MIMVLKSMSLGWLNNMKIGIFGGTFDPIHNGHLIMASFVYEEFKLDKVLLMPAGNSPLKDGQRPFNQRLEMIKLSIEGDERISYTTIEDKYQPSYTYNTMKDLEKLSDDDFYFIMGSDSLEGIKKWYKYEDLLKEFEIIVVNRSGYADNFQLKKAYSDQALGIHTVDGPLVEISSSMIRSKVKNNESIRYYVPERVCEYIEEKQIYR